MSKALYPKFNRLIIRVLPNTHFFCLIAMLLMSTHVWAVQSSQASASSDKSAEPQQEYAENYVFSDPKQRKTFLELTAELRCPKCQNQNIADSDAPIAHDMRRKVYQLMREGNDKPQIIDWMKQRYGDFVYYQPPVTAVTIWLWVLPVLFALIMLVFFIKRRKPLEQDDVDEKLAKADSLLNDN